MSKKRVALLVILSVILWLSIFFAVNIYFENNPHQTYKIIVKNSEINQNNTRKIVLSIKDYDGYLCYISSKKTNNYKWNNKCKYNLKPGNYYAYIKLKNNHYYYRKFLVKEINYIISSNIDMLDTYYLAVGGSKQLNINVKNYSENVEMISSDNNIVTIENGLIKGIGNGNATITIKLINNEIKTFNIVVTDLIVPMSFNNDKDYLPCERYTEEEANLLDNILFSRVKEAGDGTRGGVVATIRFILLEFPYTIKYFNENGRLVDNGMTSHIDGEGRYYHKGLYLNKSKFASLESGAHTASGPQIWGCKLYDSFLGEYRPNGFTCSGFISWALYNGGLDTGDVGAGDYTFLNNDLSDLGPHQQITYDFMKNGTYKAGDFIARDGHAALILGISDDTIYTAESLPPKVKVYVYDRYNGIVKDPNLTYIIDMTNIYPNGEGSYTNMW